MAPNSINRNRAVVIGEYRQTVIYFCAVKAWNDLPSHVVNALTANTFKRRLDEAWKDDPIKFNHKVIIVTESDFDVAYESVSFIIII